MNMISDKTFTKEALELIAIYSRGHLRNAITCLDQLMSFTNNITVQDVEKVLGVTSYDILFNILECILMKNQQGLLSSLDTLVKSGMDLKLFVKNFLAFVLDINKYIILKQDGHQSPMDLTSLPKSFESRLRNYNITHKEALKSLLKTLIELNSSLKWETDVRPVLETNLLMEVL